MKKKVLLNPGDVIQVGLGEGTFAWGLVTHVSKNSWGGLVSYPNRVFSGPYDEHELKSALAVGSIRMLQSLFGFEHGKDWQIVANNAPIPTELQPMPFFLELNQYLEMDPKCPMTLVRRHDKPPPNAPVMKLSVAGSGYVGLYLKKVLINDPNKLPNDDTEA